VDLYIIIKSEYDQSGDECPSQICGVYDSIEKADEKISEFYEKAKKDPCIYSSAFYIKSATLNSSELKHTKSKGFHSKSYDNKYMKEWISEWS